MDGGWSALPSQSSGGRGGMRCAIVGHGVMGRRYAATLARSPEVDAVVVADPDPEARRACAGAETFADHASLPRDFHPDARRPLASARETMNRTLGPGMTMMTSAVTAKATRCPADIPSTVGHRSLRASVNGADCLTLACRHPWLRRAPAANPPS